jgi:predicted nucleic acid-binding protein
LATAAEVLGAKTKKDTVNAPLREVGQHRSAGPIDLLIAATAEQARLTILCEDRDFEAVASVTRQRVRLVTDIQPPPDGPR